MNRVILTRPSISSTSHNKLKVSTTALAVSKSLGASSSNAPNNKGKALEPTSYNNK